MARERDGKRALRANRSKRVPELGYYYIVTDTEETERNYLTGLRDALPEELRGRIVIKVSYARTEEMVEACRQADVDPQYRQCWIVFDRDRVAGFDKIIADARRRGICAGWSNPCIETWFGAYFGTLLSARESKSCCQKFGELFEKETGLEYRKDDPRIYALLRRFGDEERAIALAEGRLRQHLRDGAANPSEMCPCTALHRLVDEIRQKTVDGT